MRSITNDFVMQRPPFGGRLKDSLFLTTHFSPNLHPQKSKIQVEPRTHQKLTKLKGVIHLLYVYMYMHRLVAFVVLLTHVCYWQPHEELSFQFHLFRPTEMKTKGNWREPSSNLVSHFWLLYEQACSRFHHARLTDISPAAEFPKSKGE